MTTKFQDWIAAHPGVPVDGDPSGRWLVFKKCLNKARRFDSYFAAHHAVLNHEHCQCSGYHEIVEIAPEPVAVRKAYAVGY